MTVQAVIDAITGGGKPEDIAAAISQQQRYDNYEVAELLAGAKPETATPELKEAMEKAKAEREKALHEREQMLQSMSPGQHAQTQAPHEQHQAQAARGTATTQSQHEGRRS